MIPEILFRGDSDIKGDRLLKNTLISKRILFTNLISGGYGNTIFKKSLIELVKRHINPGWGKTHFLSFTKSCEKAIEFGLYEFEGEPIPVIDYDGKWEFAILKFYTKNLLVKESSGNGVYKCSYKSHLIEFKDCCEILLINTIEYLKAHKELDVNSQLKNAIRDEEWLILPINILLNNNAVEYSAKIDMSNIIDYELYNVY